MYDLHSIETLPVVAFEPRSLPTVKQLVCQRSAGMKGLRDELLGGDTAARVGVRVEEAMVFTSAACQFLRQPRILEDDQSEKVRNLDVPQGGQRGLETQSRGRFRNGAVVPLGGMLVFVRAEQFVWRRNQPACGNSAPSPDAGTLPRWC
jgi:hypothetical protein